MISTHRTYRTRSGTVPCDKAGLANTLLAQEDQFELPDNGKLRVSELIIRNDIGTLIITHMASFKQFQLQESPCNAGFICL